MGSRRQIIAVLAGALAIGAIGRADMVPLSPLDAAGVWQSPGAHTLSDSLPACSPSPFSASTDLRSSPFGLLPQPNPGTAQLSETKPPQILTDRQNSLTLCLYALLGLGLCRSAPLVKRLHLGYLPDWYHSGGPSQIGHSFAISPDCLSVARVFWFIQPELTAATQDLLPQHRWRIVVSVWRQSQFAATTLTSRGPPPLS